MLFHKNEKIIFIGDSVTDDGRARPEGEGLWNALGNGYVHLIDTFLTVDYPELELRVINKGISGNTTEHLLARWDEDVTKLDPDWVVLLIGANDVWRQFDSPAIPEQAVLPEQYRKNLNTLADRTKAKMIWMTPYYLETNEADLMRARMDEYGRICKEEAAKRKIPCIDLQAAFSEILKHRYPAFITWDRVHPGWVGSNIIARAFLKKIGYEARYPFHE